nr:hypothetical protein [Tanacetum cinerariifolium]
MEALPSPDYILRPEAPPSPDYISGPEAPPLPDYIPGLEYQEYLPPAEDVLLAENSHCLLLYHLLLSRQDTSRRDDDADDDGDDLSGDDADDDDEEESSDSEEEEEEHLAPTVPAPALYSSVSASEKIEPFEECETAATPPAFGYLSPTSYPLPPFLMPLPIFTPLPTSSFPLPLSIPSTSGSESILEVDIPLQKKALFTTPTGGYEVGESSVAAAARQIRPALTIANKHRADDRLIGRLRREEIFSHLVYHLYTGGCSLLRLLYSDHGLLPITRGLYQYISDSD